MFQTTINIQGMACGMCEAHVADAIRNAFPEAKKVKASYKKEEATFLSEAEVDLTKLEKTIEDTGYHYVDAKTAPYEKKGLFGR